MSGQVVTPTRISYLFLESSLIVVKRVLRNLNLSPSMFLFSHPIVGNNVVL